MKRIQYLAFAILCLQWSISCTWQHDVTPASEGSRYTYRGWNILSSHRENGLKTLDKAAAYGVNHIELSHYQLCHDLKDLRNPKNREATNFLINAAHERNIEEVYVWDHAFYEIDYYPDSFKVETKGQQDLTHHTNKFQGALRQQLNLDDPGFWQWVYNDYDSLLTLIPNVDGIVLTFIETGSYVIYQHSERLQTEGQKLAALVDSLGGYFIDRKGLQLTIRTFIYNQFEKEVILDALKRIGRKDIKVMIKMVPHDWFLTYPYQNYVADIPFPVVIEYDGGMEYAGENIIANTFPEYFADAFRYYHPFENVVGYCARTDRFEETAAVGTPGEVNLFVLSEMAKDPNRSADDITIDFIKQNYGEVAVPLIKSAFDSAFSMILSSMYTLGLHTANHSRLNFHRNTIYQRHTTGEWYPPDQQLRHVGHDVNKMLHNYRDVVNRLSFPKYKVDTSGLQKDIDWVLDSNWLASGEQMSWAFLADIMTEKDYAVALAETAFKNVEAAVPLIPDQEAARQLYHTFRRTVIFARERRGAAKAVYGYRLWSRGENFQTKRLQDVIYDGLTEAEAMLDSIDQYPVHTPEGQWRWHRDRESFAIYKEAITQTGWKAFGLEGVTVPKPTAVE